MNLELVTGTSAVLASWATVEAGLVAGLVRGRAGVGDYLRSPVMAIPLTLAAGLGSSLAASAAHVGLTGGIIAGAAISAATGYGYGRLITRRTETADEFRRGAQVREAAPARARRVRGAGLSFAGRELTALDETKHFKLIGSTGTGKSTLIAGLLEQALARGDRAVIADPDGGYLRRFYDPRRDRILNPFDPRSQRWDLFREIRNGWDVEQLARSLIPDHEGSDRSWRAYSRTFFTAVTRQLDEAGVRDTQELYRTLLIAGHAELRTLLAGTPAQPFLDEHNVRMFDSIRSVTASAVSVLEHVARQDGPPLGIRDWIGGRGGRSSDGRPGRALFIPYRAGEIATLHSAVSAWMRLAIFEAMDREEAGDQRLWFVVDELDAVGPIDGLKDALARLRKFGGRTVVGFQSIAQVSGTYGTSSAHTIVENCGTTAILRCSASEHGGTSRFASGLIGEREILRTSRSGSERQGDGGGSTSWSSRVTLESAVLASEIEQLPDLTAFVKLASGTAWEKVRFSPLVEVRRTHSQEAPRRGLASRLSHGRSAREVPGAGREDD